MKSALKPSKPLGWQVVVFTLIRLALNMVFRMVYPFRGEFERALGVSYAQMSRGLGVRSFLGFFAPLSGPRIACGKQWPAWPESGQLSLAACAPVVFPDPHVAYRHKSVAPRNVELPQVT